MFGLGKSYCGNGILGKECFESKCCWLMVIRNCYYYFDIRNGLKYYVFDILGMNLIEEMEKEFDVKIDIRCCLYGLYLGYYVIIFVLLVIERIIKEFFKLFDNLFEENVYKYMIIIIFKLENDENKLNEIIKNLKELK